jgi:uncharacterized protein (DUF362 family)/Pyruvate/2-oxoacid:ferredoxin oxidoreductase delta subunit
MPGSHVTVYKCESYDPLKIKNVIAGSLAGLSLNTKKVLLKPNMLQAHSPAENVTTHPAVVEAVAQIVIDAGGDCRIGDSPSGSGRENAVDFFDGQSLRKLDIPGGRLIKTVYLPESYFTYDLVINLPKLKTHALTGFTLGVKNMFGVIPGRVKADLHRIAPHPEKFAVALCDIYSAVKPAFTVLDAIEGMQGEGPVTGDTVRLNRIFTGADANALDAAVVRMCGVNPGKIYLIREIAARGIGNIENTEVIRKYEGGDAEFIGFKTSFIPALSRFIPIGMLDRLARLIRRRPAILHERCISCSHCSDICPVKAIAASKDGVPYFDMEKCIKCFCCAERCTEQAIIEKRSLLAKLFP